MTNTAITKGRDGWEAETIVDLGLTRPDHSGVGDIPLHVRVSTGKDSRGGVWTLASVEGTWNHGITFTTSDWRKVIQRDKTVRCTEKTVRLMHAKALETLAEIVAEAKAHYPAAALADA